MDSRRGALRREFLKSTVAIGGATAFSACVERESSDVPVGPEDLSSHPKRQHAWNNVLPTNDYGNVVPPRHRILMFLDYRRRGEPSDRDRDTVENSLQGVERAYERSGDGLLLTTSYSPAYFERFDTSLEEISLPRPEALSSLEDPKLDDSDAVVHLASNHAQVVLGAEEALRGREKTLNGIKQPESALTEVFEVVDRRTGFIGEGLPQKRAVEAEDVPAEKVPDDAPLFMGFESGFERSQASEGSVTIESGPFAGGTTQHISKIRLDLDQWYNQDDRWQREAKMFCPYHAEHDAIEGTGENLGAESGVANCGPADKTAREMGVVGHAQKLASAREDGEPLLLRRDFNSTDGGAGHHFVSLQRRIEDFVATREAMNGKELVADSAVGQRTNNGILQYLSTRYRGNYLIPPRRLRALPSARPTRETGVATE